MRQKIVYSRLKSKELEGEQLSHYIKPSVKMFANKLKVLEGKRNPVYHWVFRTVPGT